MAFRIGWFSTGKDRQARDLFQNTWEHIEKGRLGSLRISYAFLNMEWGEGEESDRFIRLCEYLGVPVICLSSRKFKPELRREGLKEEKKGNSHIINRWRKLYDEKVMEKIREYPIEAILLAGYMLIMGEDFCRKFFVLNLHPAAPGGPKGSWQEVIWQLIEKRAERTGIMVHRVTPELDAGPAITYCMFPVKGKKFDNLWARMEQKLKCKSLEEIKEKEGETEPLFATIREEQKKRETPLILATLKYLAEGEVDLRNIQSPVQVNLDA